MPVEPATFTLIRTTGAKPIRLKVFGLSPGLNARPEEVDQTATLLIDTSAFDGNFVATLLAGGKKYETGLFEFSTSVKSYMAVKNIAMKSIIYDVNSGPARNGYAPRASLILTYQFVSISYGSPKA